MNDFDKELLKNCVSKEDIDDFNNWLKHRPIAEKLDDFFTFNILMPLTTFWYFIQIHFRGLKWWKNKTNLYAKIKLLKGCLIKFLIILKTIILIRQKMS